MKPRSFRKRRGWPGFVERAAYSVLSKSPRHFVIPLLGQSYPLYSQTALNYDEYVANQRHKTGQRFRDGYERSWTSAKSVEKIAGIACDILGARPLKGVCHGSRFGKEVDWFEAALPDGSQMIGTEIEPSVTHANTIVHDFHDPLPDHGPFDFVYSNSYDHALDPKRAMQTWIDSLAPSGLIMLEHSRGHGKLYVDDIDVFGVETELVPYLMLDWFDGKVSVRRKIAMNTESPFHVLYVLQSLET